MKRPEKLKILGKRFSVGYVTDAMSEDLNGECDTDKQLISIRDGQPLESEQDTLLHEVIHAIDEAMTINMKEAQVKGSATGLLAVLKDNPALSTYLRRKK